MTKEESLIRESLVELVEYNWDNERTHFEETFEMSISSQDTLE